jgi:hypothetical protein
MLTASYSSGDPALTTVSSPYTAYSGDARLRIALGKKCATYVEYLLYYYNFTASMPVPTGIPPGLTRNTVRAGLTLWIPVRHR